MRSISSSLLVASSLLCLVALEGCAADSGHDANDSADIASTSANVTGDHAASLMAALQKVDAPSSAPAGVLGVGSRVARIQLSTAQGGMAHFISQSGELSTLDGAALGNAIDTGVAWKDLGDALVAGGAKWATVAGDHGASSSSIFARVECKQVVSPTAKPTCTVSPLLVTEADATTLMGVLTKVDAPSATPAGVLGVGSRVARFTLETSQGGMAHFISQSLEVTSIDGKKLGDISSAGAAWSDVRAALLDGAAVWSTKSGAAGASSSTIVADVTCSQVVAPSAKPTCTISPVLGTP